MKLFAQSGQIQPQADDLRQFLRTAEGIKLLVHLVEIRKSIAEVDFGDALRP